MNLDQFERDSALWKRLEKHMNERLEVCRRKNDSRVRVLPNPEAQASHLRQGFSASKALKLLTFNS